MTYPSGVQIATLTFSNPGTFLGNAAARTEVTVQSTAGVVWTATGQPIDDFPEVVAPGPGLPGQLTVPFVDQPGFTDQAGNTFTMWAYVITRKTILGSSQKVVTKNWAPVIGQDVTDFDNLPGGTIGLPVSAPPVPVTSVASLTGVVGAAALAGELVDFIPDPVTPESVAANLPGYLEADAIADGLAPKLDAADAATAYAAKSVETSKLDASARGAASGVAGLDASSKLLETNIPTRLSVGDLSATYAPAASTPRWRPSTAYTAADVVVSPGGALVKANTSFTSGTSYSGTNWTVIAPFAQMPRYYDDGGNYADRGSLQTIARNLADPPALAGSPALVFSEFNLVSGKGDNATFRGVGAAQFQARDRTDVDATNKGVLYAIQAVVAPQIDRNNVPFDDVVGLSIVNQGTAIGTDALYFGNNRADKIANPTGKDFSNVIQIDMRSDSAFRSVGYHDVGISFGGATITTTAIRLGNAQSIAWNDGSTGAVVHALRMTSANTLRLYEGGIDIRSDKSVYFNNKAVLSNNTPLKGIKFGVTTEIELIKANASDAVSIFADALQVFASGDVAIKNNKGLQAQNAAASSYLELVRLTSSDNLTLYGGKLTVLSAGGNLLSNVSSVPSTPTGAGALYVEAGALKYKGSSGTITTLGPA